MKAELTVQELKGLDAAFNALDGLTMDAARERLFKVGRAFVTRKLRELEMKAGQEQSQWNNWAPHYGFKPTDFGRQFVLKSRRFQIVGINPNAPRFAIEAKRLPDGKGFRVPPDCVKRGLV